MTQNNFAYLFRLNKLPPIVRKNRHLGADYKNILQILYSSPSLPHKKKKNFMGHHFLK